MVDKWRDSNNDEQLRSWDRYVHARCTIDHEHRMIHDGFAFHCTNRTVGVANGASADLLVSVPAGAYPHITAFIFSLSDSPIDLETYEGVTTSDDGTLLSRFNRNRNSSNTPTVEMFSAPTITDLGTRVHDRYVPDAGGQGSNQVGSLTPNLGEEWILRPATKYIVRLTNNSGGSLTYGMEALWYEVGYDN